MNETINYENVESNVLRELNVQYPIDKIRKNFPTLHQKIHGHQLVYLDNAATTLKPKEVIDAVTNHYAHNCSNIHRGVHYLSEQATIAFENTREKIRKFIHAKSSSEIIFTCGTTASINLVSLSYGRKFLKRHDEIIISHMEHHSNIVPWQILCEEIGCRLLVAPINDHGELDFDKFEELLSQKTKFVSMTFISNTLGTINPVQKIIDAAHKVGAKVLIDGAQAVSNLSVDVQKLDCDFFVFSGHKLFGPTGVGVLYGKYDLLESMPPIFGGGDMISSVTFEKTTYNEIPYKFEAGTPHIAGVIGLGAAIDYVGSIGFDKINRYETQLLSYATSTLESIPGLTIIGKAKEKSAIISFILDDIHPHDIGTIIDHEGIAVRTGHHCTQPLMDRFKIPATTRASFSLYNTRKEIDALVSALHKVKEHFHAN